VPVAVELVKTTLDKILENKEIKIIYQNPKKIIIAVQITKKWFDWNQKKNSRELADMKNALTKKKPKIC